MQVRRARRDDLPAIQRLFADDEFHGARERAADTNKVEAAFDEIDQDPRQLLWVAEEDGHVVGTLQITLLRHLSFSGASAALVESVHVAKEARNRGIGTHMMQAAVAEARRRGCNRVQLTSSAARKDAHRFYERLGFTASHVGFKRFL